MIKKIFEGKLNKRQFSDRWLLSSCAYLIFGAFFSSFYQGQIFLLAIFFLILFIFTLIYRVSLYVRRLRDIHKNVWISVIGLFPFIDIIIFIALLFDLNKFITIIIIIITLFCSVLPITFLLKIKKDSYMENNSIELNSCYLLSKGDVYYYERSEFNNYIKLNTYSKQFVALDSKHCYGKDEKHVYFREKVLEGENPETFIITEERYAEDNNKYYDTYRKKYNTK
jgi:uncharacterized membrane protein YhaH (DUF805 family)